MPDLKDDLILDRDGTLNVERNYLSGLDRVELLPGPVEGLKWNLTKRLLSRG